MEMKFLLLLFDRRCSLGVGLSSSHQRCYQTKLMMPHDRNDTHLDDNPGNYNKYFAIIHIQTDTCCNAGILFLSGKASIVTFRLAVEIKSKTMFLFYCEFKCWPGQSVNERKIEFRENFLKAPAESDVRGYTLLMIYASQFNNVS